MKTVSWKEREHIYSQRGNGKGGEQITSKDTAEGWLVQEIERGGLLHKYNIGVWN